jgi:hypothetical protein
MPKAKGGNDGGQDDLKKRAAQGHALISQIRELFSEAHEMPSDDRRRSTGRVGDDESIALQGVVGAMEIRPASFEVLADEDEGEDPLRLETELMRARFARRDTYSGLAEELRKVATIFEDEAMAQGALVVPVARAAYEIAKPLSRRDPAVREKLAPALNYYGANGTAAAAARKANKESKNKG